MNSVTDGADVIIVGSGPAGVSAAWPLVDAGVCVLMLDASGAGLPGYPAQPSLAELRRDPHRLESELGGVGPLADIGVSPKLATPLARAVLGDFGATAGVDSEGYMALGSRAAGGLSRIWGALAARYGEVELAAFPDGGRDVRASYDAVARRIGVSGGEAVEDADPASFAPPIAHVAARHGALGSAPGFELTTAPNAVLAAPLGEREACNACGLCIHGCSRGSIYHSTLELPALRRFRNFAYRPGVSVEKLSADGGMQTVHARVGAETVSFRAPLVILAAGTLATTSLALRRIGLTGVPVRLESNPVGGMAFVIPRFIGRALPERSFGLGQLFYRLELEPSVHAAGVLYGADTLPLAPVADRLPFTRPTALRAARALAPALVLATVYLPGRFSDNQIVVEDDGGAGRMRITGHQSPATERRLSDSFDRLARMARRRGAWAIPGSRQILMPGADAHPAGTLPLGGTGPAATDVTGELNGAPGVFIADGAALPLLSASHPTLTIMANADRLGRVLARRFGSSASLSRAG